METNSQKWNNSFTPIVIYYRTNTISTEIPVSEKVETKEEKEIKDDEIGKDPD